MRRVLPAFFVVAGCGASDGAAPTSQPSADGGDPSVIASPAVDAGTPDPDGGAPDASVTDGLTVMPSELVFSGVKLKKSAPQTVTVTNVGSTPRTVASAKLVGASFLLAPSALPATLEPGETWTLTAMFSPAVSPLGSLSASVEIVTDLGPRMVPLFGLATNGEQGANEPPFQAVVDTLGFGIDVGGKTLILGTGAAHIGDEVAHPTFKKAGSGPVGLRAVARYSPNEVLPFGWYVPPAGAGAPTTHEVATIALGADQTLNPTLQAPGTQTFDPGDATFGIYVESKTFDRKTYTEDARNTGPTVHATRVYPLADRRGVAIPHAFLVGFEDAANGDYQDYVFVVTNVVE